MPLHANEWMTPDEQVVFTWKYRGHFATVTEHNRGVNIERARGHMIGEFRNAWIELAAMPDAKSFPPCPVPLPSEPRK